MFLQGQQEIVLVNLLIVHVFTEEMIMFYSLKENSVMMVKSTNHILVQWVKTVHWPDVSGSGMFFKDTMSRRIAWFERLFKNMLMKQCGLEKNLLPRVKEAILGVTAWWIWIQHLELEQSLTKPFSNTAILIV